jgi:hypothetical protein
VGVSHPGGPKEINIWHPVVSSARVESEDHRVGARTAVDDMGAPLSHEDSEAMPGTPSSAAT